MKVQLGIILVCISSFWACSTDKKRKKNQVKKQNSVSEANSASSRGSFAAHGFFKDSYSNTDSGAPCDPHPGPLLPGEVAGCSGMTEDLFDHVVVLKNHSAFTDFNLGFGKGMFPTFESYLYEDGNDIYIVDGSQLVRKYDKTTGKCVWPKGNRSTIAASGNDFILTKHDLSEYTFKPNGSATNPNYDDVPSHYWGSSSDRANNTVNVTRDATSKLITQIAYPNGKNLTITYNSNDLATSVSFNGETVTFTYDSNDQLTKITDAGNNDEDITYSSVAGEILTRKYMDITKTYTRDSEGRVTSVKDETTGYETTYEYASDHFIVTSPLNIATKVVFGTDGKWDEKLIRKDTGVSPKSVVWDSRETATWTGDTITTYLNHNSKATSTYDSDNRPLTVSIDGGKSCTYAYDSDGNMTSAACTIDSVTYTSTLEYNSDHRITKVTHPNGDYEEFGYDADSNLTSMKLNGKVYYSATYDSRGLRTSETDANGVVINFTYDGTTGQLTNVSSQGENVAVTRDSKMRVTATAFTGGPRDVDETFTYEDSGNFYGRMSASSTTIQAASWKQAPFGPGRQIIYNTATTATKNDRMIYNTIENKVDGEVVCSIKTNTQADSCGNSQSRVNDVLDQCLQNEINDPVEIPLPEESQTTSGGGVGGSTTGGSVGGSTTGGSTTGGSTTGGSTTGPF